MRGIGEGHLNFIFVVTVEPTINLNLPDVLAFTQITGISLCCLVTEAYGCAQLAQGCYPTMRWSGNRVSTPLGKSWNCVCIISRTCKVLENEFCPGKSWTFKCKVLESPEICYAMMWTQLCGCRRQNMHIRAPLIHPSIAAIVYSACGHACSIFVCGLCRYTMFNRLKCSIGHMTGSWKNASVFLQSPGKVLEFFCDQRAGTPRK